ncbi:alpha/beta hydrolase [Thalassotalea euphylliae]|uniref:alpha/beta hydrolase n=1 Tax=Thalassotalea euphylliae TaxID=1655234 RepID=UPI003638B06C
MNINFYAIKSAFAIWSRVFPSRCSPSLVKLLFTVRRNVYPFKKVPFPSSTLYVENDTTLSHWRGESEKSILLIHGWDGSGDQFSRILKGLLADNYSVYLVQPKGYGKSSSKLSNPGQFIKSIHSSLQYINEPLVATIGHSMGAGAMLHVASQNIDLGKLVSIAAPSDFTNILKGFCNKLSVGKACQRLFLDNVEKEVRVSHSDLKLDAHMSKIPSPILLIHDENDSVLSYKNAESLNKSNAKTTLISTKNLGHNRILNSDYVFEQLLDFVKRD